MAPGPVLILAVHLCDTLPLRAVDLFNDNPAKVHFLALKQCCQPGMTHSQREEVFQVGQHSFDAKLLIIWRQPDFKDRTNTYDLC